MATREKPGLAVASRANTAARAERLRGGGTTGNERLTNVVGATLLILLAVIGVTIIRIHDLLSVHLFVGMLLVGPVLLISEFGPWLQNSGPFHHRH